MLIVNVRRPFVARGMMYVWIQTHISEWLIAGRRYVFTSTSLGDRHRILSPAAAAMMARSSSAPRQMGANLCCYWLVADNWAGRRLLYRRLMIRSVLLSYIAHEPVGPYLTGLTDSGQRFQFNSIINIEDGFFKRLVPKWQFPHKV